VSQLGKWLAKIEREAVGGGNEAAQSGLDAPYGFGRRT
jgi:hypothetical protein